MKCQSIAYVTVVTVLGYATAIPKYETGAKDSEGSGGIYHGKTEETKLAQEEEGMMSKQTGPMQEEGQIRPPRFGFPTYAQDIQATGNALPGLYGPVKLDIGGLVLGTIVGLGAFFILPKLFHVAAAPYVGYKRSEDEEETGNGLTDFMSQVQAGLDAYDVDTSACVQRAICSSLQAANEKVGNETANGFESIVDGIARNDIFKSLLEGTDWRQAIDAAEKGQNCAVAFSKCPNELVTVISTISRYLVSSM